MLFHAEKRRYYAETDGGFDLYCRQNRVATTGVPATLTSFCRLCEGNPYAHVPFLSCLRPSQAPNFAYALTARKFLALDPQPQLDLSSVRHMINAAEPVDATSIDRFYAVFESHGLRR